MKREGKKARMKMERKRRVEVREVEEGMGMVLGGWDHFHGGDVIGEDVRLARWCRMATDVGSNDHDDSKTDVLSLRVFQKSP